MAVPVPLTRTRNKPTRQLSRPPFADPCRPTKRRIRSDPCQGRATEGQAVSPAEKGKTGDQNRFGAVPYCFFEDTYLSGRASVAGCVHQRRWRRRRRFTAGSRRRRSVSRMVTDTFRSSAMSRACLLLLANKSRVL